MRRFLQGLGLGLLVAAIVMGIGTRSNGSSSDDNIVERARELGMVFPKEAGTDEIPNPDMTEAPVSTDDSEAASGSGAVGAGVGGDGGIATSTAPEESEEPTATPNATKAPKKTTEPKATSKPTEKPEETKEPKESESSDPNATPSTHKVLERGTVVNFKVRSGLLSSSVARELYEAGIIEDMWDFDHYIVRNNLGDRIIAGEYELKVGDSYAKIARIITHSS